MTSVLFVCTGNIFRSMTAEYVLKKLLDDDTPIQVSSAGTEARLQEIPQFYLDYVLEKGINPAGHRQRKLTSEILAETDVVVAMGLDHRNFIATKFGQKAWLFNEICCNVEEGILDVWEAVPNWKENSDVSIQYTHIVFDYILGQMPAFLENVEYFREK